MESKLGARIETRERRRALAWKADAIEPPIIVSALGLLAHEVAALKSMLLALDGQVHVPVRFGDGTEAHIVVVSRSVLRDARFNAGLRGRRVIVYRHESDAPARADDVVISAPIRVVPLLEALNVSFDRLGAAIRSGAGVTRAGADVEQEPVAPSGTVAHALQRVFAQSRHHDTHVRVIGVGTLSILAHRGRYFAEFPASRLREAMRCRRYVLSGNCDDAKRMRDQQLRPLLELRWLAALEGHDAATTSLPQRFRLTRWPDFAQLPHDDAHLTLAALLSGQTLTLDSASKLCDADPQVVAAFLAACQAGGYLVAADAAQPAPRTAAGRGPAGIATSNAPGLFARLLGALRSP